MGVFILLAIGLMFGVRGLLLAVSPKHDFTGQCQLCHTTIPEPGTPFEQVALTDEADRLCQQCHKMGSRTSHPTGVKPQVSIPLERYLDKEGRITCITCHEVHKEQDRSFNRQELQGLLRGHTQGRAFCFVCHNQDILGAKWRHSMVVAYAHSPGQLSQNPTASLLDEYSVECLSCHDGVISKMTPIQVKGGDFKHGIGLSHPVGVEYPVMGGYNEFNPRNTLPEEVKLFNGTVGCLSCHDPYSKKKPLLVMDNTRSALCLTCHRK